jgi:hypothetical protein
LHEGRSIAFRLQLAEGQHQIPRCHVGADDAAIDQEGEGIIVEARELP